VYLSSDWVFVAINPDASLRLQMSCLYKYGDTHLGLPPPDSGL
jgi:hypothetical protein